MIEAPLGGAAFNNEFGRPNLAGYFRTFEMEVARRRARGATATTSRSCSRAASATSAPNTSRRREIPPGAAVVVLGGPAMLIGLGGGAASSLASGASQEDLDFASVQRDNAEMQRRCQEVIDRCGALGDDNPILSIHDVGAGGLSNALPELVHDSGRGARVELRDIPSDEPGLSPLELWCNEAQERYVLAIAPERLATFAALCGARALPARGRRPRHRRRPAAGRRQRCSATQPIDLPLAVLLGKPPRMTRERGARRGAAPRRSRPAAIHLARGGRRVLRLPTVADKTFLITIGDRTVGGLVARDQMVGPWQVPVADAAVTADRASTSTTGEAMAMGERAPVALLDAAASARLAIARGDHQHRVARRSRSSRDIKLSANWMAAAGHPGEDARALRRRARRGRRAVPRRSASPSRSARTRCRCARRGRSAARRRSVTAPLSLIVTRVRARRPTCAAR